MVSGGLRLDIACAGTKLGIMDAESTLDATCAEPTPGIACVGPRLGSVNAEAALGVEELKLGTVCAGPRGIV